MAYDARPGQPYSPTVYVTDANGNAVTGTTTGSKTMTVVGPLGTTVGSGTVTHRGGGWWGIDLAGTATAQPGTYRATLDTITSGTYTLTNATVTFDVGYDNSWSLRELYTQVRHSLRDGQFGQTTATGTATTLYDTKRFMRGSNNDWVGSELFFLDPQAVTDDNPVIVTSFVPTQGLIVFANNTVTATVAGMKFILGNLAGLGWTHTQVMEAIRLAVRRAGHGGASVDETSLTYSTSLAEYVPPAQFAQVTDLAYQEAGAYQGQWHPIAQRYWDWDPLRRRIIFTQQGLGVAYLHGYSGGYGRAFDIPNGSKLRIMGTTVPQLPSTLGAPIEGDGAKVRDMVLIDLLMQRPEPEHRQRAAMLAGQMGRPTVRMPG